MNRLPSFKSLLLLFLAMLPLGVFVWALKVSGTSAHSIQPLQRPNYPIARNALVVDCEVGKYGGTFILTSSTEPKTFNYLVPADAATGSAIGNVLGSLLGYHPIKETYVGELATHWEISEDQKTYTFYLREGILWSDGIPFSAEDVIFTMDCLLSTKKDPKTDEVVPRYPSRYYSQFKYGDELLKYEKVDDYTVVFKLPETYAPFLYDIGVLILPKHKLNEAFKNGTLLEKWSTQVAINQPEEIVGLGPFLIKSYKPGERITYLPNPRYWKVDSKGQRLPYIDYFIDKFVSDSNTSVVYFATGQTDANGISAGDYYWVEKASKTYDFTIHNMGPSGGISFYWLNQHRGKDKEGEAYLPPYKLAWFTNKHFRHALLHALDRQGIIDAVFFGRGSPLHSFISPAHQKWHNPHTKKYLFDLDKSAELLDKSGFFKNEKGELLDKDENRVEFEMIVYDGSKYATVVSNTLKSGLDKLGIKLNISVVDFSTLLKRMDNHAYDMALVGWGSSSAAYDPSGSKVAYLSSGQYHFWHPKQKTPATEWEGRIDELFNQQERTLDLKKRIEMMHEIQAILADELPLMYLINPNSYVGVRNRWNNIRKPKAGTILWNIEEIWTEPPTPSP